MTWQEALARDFTQAVREVAPERGFATWEQLSDASRTILVNAMDLAFIYDDEHDSFITAVAP